MMITVISPMYNEELIIEKSVKNMLKKLSELKEEWEYIVVNDGSTDKSLEIVSKIAAEHQKLKIVSYEINRGRGYALRQGFKAAKGDIIITTEADSSWGENIVLEFLEHFKKNPTLDMIIASPHLEGGGYRNVPLYRVLLSKWGNIILKWSVFGKLTMLSGMCRAYKRYVIDSLVLEQDKKEIHLEIISKAFALGYNIGEIPAVLEWQNLDLKKNEKRKSKFNAKKLILSHLLFSFNEAPILLLGTTSLLFILAGIAIGIFIFYQFLEKALNPTRPLITLMVILLTVGVQILVFCFLAYQNKKMQNELYKIQSSLKLLKDKFDL